ncbi:hypothetical protein GXB84_04290 [Stenotrophomonas acidaminiphila]|uniref:hypothetical protein n=1 Tax=Stenotrophomonas acidaminiphila TaxID=128780 RepID=UPI0013754E31|nr:hypothetical protein [Stenotrophomonas acidaminiphila]NCT86553.1 hypothetical protein [Stenotrophomonas acidaminiphila]
MDHYHWNERVRTFSAAGSQSLELGVSITGIHSFVCKKLYIRNNCMVLASGSGYPSIIVPEDVELEIWGVVRSSITQHL